MRKKKLLKLSDELFDRSENYRKTIEELKAENERLLNELKKLTPQNTASFSQDSAKTLEEKLNENSAVSEITEYGAQVIGKIIITSTAYCNALNTSYHGEQVKELVDLILSKTDAAKSKILEIISNDLSFDDKKDSIDNQQTLAYDYFERVISQRL